MIPIHVRVAALTQALAEVEALRFGYEPEACDCVRFPARLVVNATGRDVIEGISWSDLPTAILAVRSEAETLSAAIDKRFERIAPARVLPGDLVAMSTDLEDPAFDVALGVFDGDQAIFWMGGGIRRAPLSRVLMAWRLG